MYVRGVGAARGVWAASYKYSARGGVARHAMCKHITTLHSVEGGRLRGGERADGGRPPVRVWGGAHLVP